MFQGSKELSGLPAGTCFFATFLSVLVHKHASTPSDLRITKSEASKPINRPAAISHVYGNTLERQACYNNRLQMSAFIDLANSNTANNSNFCQTNNSDPANQLLNVALTWNPGDTTKDDGNLWAATYNHGGPGQTSFLQFTQSYLYDGVNRLTKVSDTNYARSFGYDASGNMWAPPSNATGITASGNTPAAATDINSNNQLNAATYDQAGNQQTVNGNSIIYDTEGRQSAVSYRGQTETYVYDGDGKRVEKMGPNGSPVTVFVYDARVKGSPKFPRSSRQLFRQKLWHQLRINFVSTSGTERYGTKSGKRAPVYSANPEFVDES